MKTDFRLFSHIEEKMKSENWKSGHLLNLSFSVFGLGLAVSQIENKNARDM